MPQALETKPVGDDVPRVDGAVAVGEDLKFQRRWWRFEKVIWVVFSLILVADLAGLLGRGPLANAKLSNGSAHIKYERIMRENTASILTVLPENSDIHDGKLQLFVSDSIVKQLGAQRVIPAPLTSNVGSGGVTYTFPVTQVPITLQFELKPSFIGVHSFTVAIPGTPALQAKTLVLP